MSEYWHNNCIYLEIYTRTFFTGLERKREEKVG